MKLMGNRGQFPGSPRIGRQVLCPWSYLQSPLSTYAVPYFSPMTAWHCGEYQCVDSLFISMIRSGLVHFYQPITAALSANV